MSWEKFFADHLDYVVDARFYECSQAFTVEELYQAFKERLQAELMVDVHGTSHYGLLVERNDGKCGDKQ